MRTVLVILVAALSVADASAQQPAPHPLVTAVTSMAAGTIAPGWRTQILPGGTIAAIVVGAACGRDGVEVAHGMVGNGSRPRALVTKNGATSVAYAFDPAGGVAAADGLTEMRVDQVMLGERPFAHLGADEAIRTAVESCAAQDRHESHPRQLAWHLHEIEGSRPSLVLARPSTDWRVLGLACSRPARQVTISSAVYPREAEIGTAAQLALAVDGRAFSAPGKITMDDGEEHPWLRARFGSARDLLDRLRLASEIVIQSGKARMTVSGRALGALLPRFEAACGLKPAGPR